MLVAADVVEELVPAAAAAPLEELAGALEPLPVPEGAEEAPVPVAVALPDVEPVTRLNQQREILDVFSRVTHYKRTFGVEQQQPRRLPCTWTPSMSQQTVGMRCWYKRRCWCCERERQYPRLIGREEMVNEHGRASTVGALESRLRATENTRGDLAGASRSGSTRRAGGSLGVDASSEESSKSKKVGVEQHDGSEQNGFNEQAPLYNQYNVGMRPNYLQCRT